MRLRIFLLAFLVNCFNAVELQPHSPDLIRKETADERGFAQFDGQIWVDGTLVAQWVKGIDEEPDSIKLNLEVDTVDARNLPNYIGYTTRSTRVDVDDL